MWLPKIFILLVFILKAIEADPTTIVVDEEKKITRIKLNETVAVEMNRNWHDQAVSGIMAAIATKALADLPKNIAERHKKCSKTATNVNKHAECVSNLLKIKEKHHPTPPTATPLSPAAVHKFKPKLSIFSLQNRHKEAVIIKKRNEKTWIGSFGVSNDRKKREISSETNSHGSYLDRLRSKSIIRKSSPGYTLTHNRKKLSPIGQIARLINSAILNAKNKTRSTPWQEQISAIEEVSKKRKELKKTAKKLRDENPLEEMTYRGLRKQIPDLEEIFEDKEKRKAFLADQDNLSQVGGPHKKLMKFLRQGIKIGMSMMGQNTTNFEEKTIRMASPRIFSIVPDNVLDSDDEDDPIDILSPSILSLHNRGRTEEKALSLHNLVQGVGNADQQELLNLIFEATDVEEHMKVASKAVDFEFQNVRKKRYQERMVNDKGEPLYFTKEKAIEVMGDAELKRIDVFEQLIQTYTHEQMAQINDTGYAIMSPDQLTILYGSKSPYHNQEKLNIFLNMTKTDIENRIIHEINERAELEKRQRRAKREATILVLTPVLLSPSIWAPSSELAFVLSPLTMSPLIGSPSVIGHIILSPWIFLPLVLSPRVISPCVLDPFLFVPVILSPLIMNPFIVCPGAFNPFILSPTIMTPFILSPQVFTPMILNPNVMSPFILSPSVGTPLILTPHLLTPLIFTPLALLAVVLSPQIASPVIESPFFFAEIIASPSLLS